MTAQPSEISTESLADHRGDPERAVIDVRPLAAFNGWRLKGESRGGHIPGATSLPSRWHPEIDLATALKEKGVSTDQSLTLYGYDGATSQRIAQILSRSGFDTPSIYSDFLNEWVSKMDHPLESLDRYQQLVNPAWLHDLIRGENPPANPSGEYVCCHVHANDLEDYRAGHVPEAIPLDISRLEATDDWNRRSPDELETALLEHGIRHDTTVILYGRPTNLQHEETATETSPGQMAAMRCATILLYAGVTDVRLLNGGLAAWEDAGYETSTENTRPECVESFGRMIPARPNLFIDTPEAKAWLAATDKDLVSVRSYEELAGETTGYDYIPETGCIPNAIAAPSGSDPSHIEEYRHPDQTMRAYPEVRAMLRKLGVNPDTQIAFYCGTGWRASEVFMHAYLMGWSDIAVYDGGWFEWTTDPENPIGNCEMSFDR